MSGSLPAPAVGDVCSETPAAPPPLGSPSGCDHCIHSLLAGTLEPHPDTLYYIESDLPERLLSTGVLYATVPVLPADASGYPNLAMRTQIASGGFVTIDDAFDVLVWHTSSPGDGSQPRRIVLYARNEGTGAIQIAPTQIMITDGSFLQMSETLATRVLEDNWDMGVSPRGLSPGTGDVIAYSKQFAAPSNSDDTSANTNCFGRVRAVVQNSDPATHPTDIHVYVVAIDGTDPSENKLRAESLLTTGATSGDPFDLNTPPLGCANRRATGVFRTFVWRSDPVTLDAETMPQEGIRFRMTLAQLNSQTCPEGRQTADMVLRPGYVRPDTVGNYMVDSRISLRLINTNPALPRAVDVRFGKTGASVGLAWQVATGSNEPTDAEVDARPVRTAWAGPSQPAIGRSFFDSDGGPLVLGPCEAKVASIRFLILGGSSLPFDIGVVPTTPTEYVVDNADAEFFLIGDWLPSAQPGCYGPDSLVHAGNAGLDRAIAIPGLLASGAYEVYAWWVAGSTRATDAPYYVYHLGGATRVGQDQTDNGSSWNLLGTFDLGIGGTSRLELTDDVPPAEDVSVDAAKFVYTGPIEVIVDNRDPGCSLVGTWPTSANAGYYGIDSQYHAGDGGASFGTWTPDLTYPGRYQVYAWWVVSSNRARQAPYDIHHRQGTTTVHVDQTHVATAARWNVLGAFDFDAGVANSVVLRADVPPNELVSADAVRFVYIGPDDPMVGDFDGDGGVDLGDFGSWPACMTGPDSGPYGASCGAFDFETDGDVDLGDFARFQGVFGVP
ncbi:MAG: hypothetical protein GY778_06765 [bacterium]|nr:hypothetical protein [bacterium]